MPVEGLTDLYEGLYAFANRIGVSLLFVWLVSCRMERAEGWLEHPVGLSVLRSKGVYRYIQTHRNTQKKGV